MTDALGLKGPLVLAPLSGGPSTPELVAAVSNAGALGSLGAAYMAPAALDQALRRLKLMCPDKPFAVNLFAPCTTPDYSDDLARAALAALQPIRNELALPQQVISPPFSDDFAAQLAVVMQHKPAVFSFTFGLIAAADIQQLKRLGILTVGTATNLTEALALEELGVDAVAAQGKEAGGHRGMFSAEQADSDIPLLMLTRQIAEKVPLPIIACGGIMDGGDIATALAAGAQLAQLGTAFLACPEAGTSTAYRDALLSPQRPQTRLTRAFSGRLARGLENTFMRQLDSASLLPFPVQNAVTRDLRQRAAQLGKAEYLSLWAGEGVSKIRQLPAAELVAELQREWMAATKH